MPHECSRALVEATLRPRWPCPPVQDRRRSRSAAVSSRLPSRGGLHAQTCGHAAAPPFSQPEPVPPTRPWAPCEGPLQRRSPASGPDYGAGRGRQKRVHRLRRYHRSWARPGPVPGRGRRGGPRVDPRNPPNAVWQISRGWGGGCAPRPTRLDPPKSSCSARAVGVCRPWPRRGAARTERPSSTGAA